MSLEPTRTLRARGALLADRQPLGNAAVLPKAAEPPGSRGSFGVLPHTRGIVPQDAGTLLPVAGHGGAATRFALPIPNDLPTRPIRVYSSLKSGGSIDERVDLMIRELERTGAFRRGHLFVGIATGGGHVNPVALETVERLARGDIASVSMQYGTRPSVLSLHKVDDARDLTSALLERLRDRIRSEFPNGDGPRVLLYGESLGGWASQFALDRAAQRAEKATGATVDPLQALGVDRAAWVGIPGFSRFRKDRLGPGGMQVLRGIAELQQLPPAARAKARAWELSHLDDPVHRADLATIWRRPEWLPKGGPNPPRVDPRQRWKPFLTFAETIGMALRSANKEVPGQFTDHGHDYRKALPALLRAAYGFDDVTDAELARITEQARQSELWILKQEWK